MSHIVGSEELSFLFLTIRENKKGSQIIYWATSVVFYNKQLQLWLNGLLINILMRSFNQQFTTGRPV
jgi:hypothetical protein